jgi:hypothetical protein
MTILKGTFTRQAIHHVALRLVPGAVLFALASLVPVSTGPLEASAQASAFPRGCGGNGQRPCTVLEHIPSCKPGLREWPLGKTCSPKPKPKPLIPRPETVKGCGANGESPCKINQAFPSCEGNLVEDFAIGRCRRNDGDFVNMAKNTLREVGPILSTIANSAVRCGVDTIMLNSRNVGPAATVARLQELPCFNALLDSARSNGYQTLTIGGGGGAAFGVGAEGENGFAFDTAKRRPITTYHTLSLKFLSIGAGASVTVGLFKKDNRSFGGDAHGAAVGFAAVGGGGAAVWFDYRNDRLQGANAIITAGGRADLAYIRNTTEILPTQYAIQQALSRPTPPSQPSPPVVAGLRGPAISGFFREQGDRPDFVREFQTKGSRNEFLWYRIKDGAKDWTQWYKFTLKPSLIADQLFYETDSGRTKIFMLKDGSTMTLNQRTGNRTNAKVLRREDDIRGSGVVFGS